MWAIVATMAPSLETRVRARLAARVAEMRGGQRQLAEALGVVASWVPGYLAGAHSLRLKYLEPAADFLGISVAELVAEDEPVGAEAQRQLVALAHSVTVADAPAALDALRVCLAGRWRR